MGYNVVFWSPVPGHTGNTTNMLVVSAMLGLETAARILVLGHVSSSRDALERPFFRHREREEMKLNRALGIDALQRLAVNRKLKSEMIRDYTIPMLHQRLDFLPVSQKPDKVFVAGMKAVLPEVLQYAKQSYDMTLIDAGSGTWSSWTELLLQQADLVVVSLNQSLSVWENYARQTHESLEGKPRIAVLGRYEARSAHTVRNVARRFKRTERLFAVPHHAKLLDAMQDGELLNFLFRNRKVPMGHEQATFVNHIRQFACAIAEHAGVSCNEGEREERW